MTMHSNTQHSDIQLIETLAEDTQYNNTDHSNTQHNDIQPIKTPAEDTVK
jgi:hypothetical protein